ncbi:MAG: sigma 54-interacting transcriptional regulator [Pirellulales bacterium]|nr:sigma 54-interacting transcriptional regulator [Pirellulales bacterium]
MAQERCVDTLLDRVVRRLAEWSHVALARIWLVGPGDVCGSCPPSMEAECVDRSTCLHLVASAGNPLSPDADWSRVDGYFRRFPMGGGLVGRIVARGEPVFMTQGENGDPWVTRPQWAAAEEICAYAGQPLAHRGDVLGALVVFLRQHLLPDDMIWLRLVADHAATAIANARAFEEIERLRQRVELERDYLREEVSEAHSFGEIVGRSAALRKVLQQVDLVAPTDASVLILGESGVGKELVAREIHRRSPRRDRPLVKVNCASVPRELYESEFFGHVEGAFTGAIKDRAGRFELADGGTLFLDEVGEIPLALQGKLLRVLQEGEFERVGEEHTRRCDVRIIAATNQDLRAEVEQGLFRQDLYYRLNVFPIEVAPLRDRREDIPLLAAHFVEQAAARLHRPCPRLTQAGILQLRQYNWPGNVRELQNVIERAVITARSGALVFDLAGDDSAPPAALPVLPSPSFAPEVVPEAEMQRRERENIRLALEQSGWKIYGPGGAAELLGVRPTTLSSRVARLGLKRPGE